MYECTEEDIATSHRPKDAYMTFKATVKYTWTACHLDKHIRGRQTLTVESQHLQEGTVSQLA